MRKIPKQLSLLLLTFASLSGCSYAPLATDTQSIAQERMTNIATNIYVDPEMPEQQRKEFLKTVKQSKSEIIHFFGDMKSSPKIYACSSKKCFSRFGGMPAKAKSFDDNKVLLSSKGLDKTTLTHELTHIEFHKRLGSPELWNKVPMWFDEGLAALACKEDVNTKATTTISLNELVSRDQWIDAVRNKKPAYSIAKQAVENWYKKAGNTGLQNIIKRLQKGEKFSLETVSKTALHVSHL